MRTSELGLRSVDLAPGTVLEHARTKSRVMLDRRKREDEHNSSVPFWPGWRNTDGSGLADFVLDDPKSEWIIVGTP